MIRYKHWGKCPPLTFLWDLKQYTWSWISNLLCLTWKGHCSSSISAAVINWHTAVQGGRVCLGYTFRLEPFLVRETRQRDLNSCSHRTHNLKQKEGIRTCYSCSVPSLLVHIPCLENSASCRRLDCPTWVSNQDHPPQTGHRPTRSRHRNVFRDYSTLWQGNN